jgi:hypothetical protein
MGTLRVRGVESNPSCCPPRKSGLATLLTRSPVMGGMPFMLTHRSSPIAVAIAGMIE